MKNTKLSLRILTTVILVLVCMTFVLTGCKMGVDEEYKYNTEIISVDNAPQQGSADISAITGYSEDAEQTFVELPLEIKDTDIVVKSIGKYTGSYNELGAVQDVTDILAIIVENTSEKIVSYSSITVEYDEDKTCVFNPTNLPPHQSMIVFTNSEPVAYSDVKKFECIDSMAVMASEFPLLEGVVGVDFVDGQFIVTNLTSDDLGDVYIRYKSCSDGNAYLGGVTYSVRVQDVKAYETYKIDAPDFNKETSVIIAVENLK